MPTIKKSKPVAKKKAPNSVRILVANGVNLDLLGSREAEHYGAVTLQEIQSQMEASVVGLAEVAGLGPVSLEFFQSNREHEFLEKLSNAYDGFLINPGAWTHTSLAIADRLRAVARPYVEVHLSNISAREEFRKKSFLAPGAAGVVYGMGAESYLAGLCGLLLKVKP